MKTLAIKTFIFLIAVIILSGCCRINNKRTDNSTISDSLFTKKLTERQLVTSRYGRFLPDGSYVDESHATPSVGFTILVMKAFKHSKNFWIK